MSAGYDAEMAELFRDLRTASNLSETDLAARIATPVEVVQALEQGAIYALPPWPETARVVNAYGSLLNLDTRPLLRRIYAQIEAGVVELRPKPVPDVPVMPPQAGGADVGLGAAPPPPQARPQPAPQAPPPQAAPPQAVLGQPVWQNGPVPLQPQAPAAPKWPGGSQQLPQGGAPGAQLQPQQVPSAQPQPQQVPGAQPQPQQVPGAPAWLNGPHALQQQPHMQAPDPAAYQQPPQAYPPGAAPLQGENVSFPPDDASMGTDAGMGADALMGADASMGADAAMSDAAMGGDAGIGDAMTGGDFAIDEPAAEPKHKRPALLKWGIAALLAAVLLVGLWMVFGGGSDTSSSSGSFASDPVLDADDPRSRKADRLPNNF